MDNLPKQTEPTHPPFQGFEEASRAYEAKLERLREAAVEWGVRPHTPEGAFMGGLIGAIAELGTMALSIGARLEATVYRAEIAMEKRVRVAESEVKALQLALRESASLLDKAQKALTLVEVDKERIIKTAVSVMSADITEALRRPMTVRATNLNTERLWIRYMMAGVAGIGVLITGLIMGEVDAAKPGMTELAIRQCAESPVTDGKGTAYCQLSRLQAGLH
jgi:hypothetical protein